MNIGERVKDLRRKKGLTQDGLAELLGYKSKSSVAHIENGRDIPRSMVVKLAEVLDTTPAYLMGWEESTAPGVTVYPHNATPASQAERSQGWAEKSEIELVSNPKIKKIPVIGRVAAGLQCFADMQIEEYAPCDASLLHTGYDYVYLRVTGDSMEPELHEGDKVLVQVRDTVESGDYAVVIVDGDDGLVKKIEYSKTQLTLISENPYYPPRRFQRDEMNRVRIFGKVVGLSRSF